MGIAILIRVEYSIFHRELPRGHLTRQLLIYICNQSHSSNAADNYRARIAFLCFLFLVSFELFMPNIIRDTVERDALNQGKKIDFLCSNCTFHVVLFISFFVLSLPY